MIPLPVDLVIPELLHSLSDFPGVVLLAPPGSGKTSRVPLALLKDTLFSGKAILMLEPRRLAAVNAASWLAKSLSERVGETVGYSIRFQRQVSRKTRLEVLTEGLLVKRLQSDPALEGIGAVVFDEFHERSIAADTALALCLDVQQTIRQDLKIVIMSATLESGPVARLLGDVPLITCEGKTFPVEIRYLGDPSGPVIDAVCQVILRANRETIGDILVFLPGSGEIRRCYDVLRESDKTGSLHVVPLYGDLPFAEQEKAILPSGQRKVVLATNIAETSLTIEGVGVVIDSGLSRRQQYDPATGMNRLVTVRVSAASAVQRAGRAGRLGPGVCFRLWSKGVHETLVPHNPPEIRGTDLAPLALELANWGVSDAGDLRWIDAPPPGALNEGRSLLRKLGALDIQDRITPLGRRMAGLPLHPRLARLVLAGEERGCVGLACDLAALLEERDIFRRDRSLNRPSTDCDYIDRIEAFYAWRTKGIVEDSPLLDIQACRVVERAARRLRQKLEVPVREDEVRDTLVGVLLAHSFPDRIARQREPGSERYLLENGTGGILGHRSALHNQPFIVVIEITGNVGGEGTIHGASGISLNMLRQEFSSMIHFKREVSWDEAHGRVSAREEERMGDLVLSARSVVPSDEEAVSILLDVIVTDPELGLLPWTQATRQFLARIALLRRVSSEAEWPDLSHGTLARETKEWLAPHLVGIRSTADLSRLDLLTVLKGFCSWEQLRVLDEQAPTHITVPSGSRLIVDYSGAMPVLAVKLQELFGLAETPKIAWGRVNLLLHLLSPARRPIQVTEDLKSFWGNTYPQVKKELKGRYPKHPWPDDPWSAVPTKGTKRKDGRN